MANVWMHNGFLQVEGKKMSKSLGNFVTIRELLETEKFGGRKWPGEVLRLAMLMTHYREPIDFSVGRLEEAEEKLRGWQRLAITAPGGAHDPDVSVVGELADDLNFHRASVALDAIARKAGRGTETALACLAGTLDFLGFSRDGRVVADATASETTAIEAATQKRLAALAARDFALADTIRADLATQGVQLMDSKDPATGERRTRWEIKR